jgi:hypothetical protein
MSIKAIINCTGLSTALTVLRIRQLLINPQQQALPLDVSVGKKCDRSLLMESLGSDAGTIRLV